MEGDEGQSLVNIFPWRSDTPSYAGERSPSFGPNYAFHLNC
jgi:hypothetical protein